MYALAVDEDRGRAEDGVAHSVVNVVLDFSPVCSAIQSRVEFCSIKPKLRRIFFERCNVQRRLVLEENVNVLEET